MNTKELEALKSVTNYLFYDEKKHYGEEGEPEDHLFKNVETLCNMLLKEGKEIEINYYSQIDFPNIGKIIEQDGKKYKVTRNSIRNVTTAELVEEDKKTRVQELTAVVSSGTFYCEHDDCDVVQTDEDEEDILFYGIDDNMYCQKHLPVTPINKKKEYTLKTEDKWAIPVSTIDLQYALDFLLDIAEEHYPNYFSCDEIMRVNDIYKKYLG